MEVDSIQVHLKSADREVLLYLRPADFPELCGYAMDLAEMRVDGHVEGTGRVRWLRDKAVDSPPAKA